MAKRGQSDHVTAVEAAKMLGVTDRQVRNMIDSGLLPATSFGRAWLIKRADVLNVPRNRKPGRKAKVKR